MEESSVLSSDQLRALAELTAIPELEHFYLAGGSGIAAHLGHRVSLDLDLFSESSDATFEPIRERLLSHLTDAEVVAETDVTLTLRSGVVAVDVVRYPYPLLEPTTSGPGGIRLAGLRDLAAMKLSAIARRGIRRDFWDLHEIVTRTAIDLENAAEAYVKRFGVRQADLYHVLRSLTYFEDAEAESVMPRGLTLEHWRVIKSYFLSEAPLLLK